MYLNSWQWSSHGHDLDEIKYHQNMFNADGSNRHYPKTADITVLCRVCRYLICDVNKQAKTYLNYHRHGQDLDHMNIWWPKLCHTKSN